jgi:homoserine kinase
MRKIKLSLPMVLCPLIGSVHSLALALSPRIQVAVRERQDQQFQLNIAPSPLPIDETHPFVVALFRVYQYAEQPLHGVQIDIRYTLLSEDAAQAFHPILGRAAAIAAGVIIGNQWLGLQWSQTQIIAFAARIHGSTAPVAAAIGGGLTCGLMPTGLSTYAPLQAEQATYRALPIKAVPLVLALPTVPPALPPVDFTSSTLLQDQSARIPLLVEAMRTADAKLLAIALHDAMHGPTQRAAFTGYGHLEEMARRAGALATPLIAEGRALLVLAERDHHRIAEALRGGFRNIGVAAQVLEVNIDTQGVVMSAAQTA